MAANITETPEERKQRLAATLASAPTGKPVTEANQTLSSGVKINSLTGLPIGYEPGDVVPLTNGPMEQAAQASIARQKTAQELVTNPQNSAAAPEQTIQPAGPTASQAPKFWAQTPSIAGPTVNKTEQQDTGTHVAAAGMYNQEFANAMDQGVKALNTPEAIRNRPSPEEVARRIPAADQGFYNDLNKTFAQIAKSNKNPTATAEQAQDYATKMKLNPMDTKSLMWGLNPAGGQADVSAATLNRTLTSAGLSPLGTKSPTKNKFRAASIFGR